MCPTLAVIVCSHIARQGALVDYALRSGCLEKDDSGWQFLCSGCHDGREDIEIWAVDEVLAYAPAIKAIIDEPCGSLFKRDINNVFCEMK